MIDHRVHDRSSVGDLLSGMAAWPYPDRPCAHLHPGDLGWHLRLHDDALAGAFQGWWHGDDLLAVGLVEGVVGRYDVAPHHERDRELAERLADACRGLPGDDAYADVRPETTLCQILVGEGWTLDPDPWWALHLDLDGWAPPDGATGAVVIEAADAVADRVAVQRAGFENSTFTEEAWHRMAAGPGYRRDLDLVVRADGVPVAVATAWWAGAGATAILEPVATHRDHRGRGWGRAVVTAALARLRDLGASGVSVATPVDYVGAVATYRSAGLRPFEQVRSLVRQSAT
jgi:predicted N-acetyltransferase YhbS